MMPVGRGAWCRFDRRQSGLSGPTGRHYELMGRARGVERKTLVVEGYNVIGRRPALAAAERHSLAGGRDALLTALRASYRHTAHTVIVVFDGDGDAEASQPFGGCRGRVIFSRHDEAAGAVLARVAHVPGATGGGVHAGSAESG